MPTGATAAAPLRHVSLVALEALLVAVLVWVAAMTLAAATSESGIAGTVVAGRGTASLAVVEARLGGTFTVSAVPGDDGLWVHASCSRAGVVILNRWVAIGTDRRAAFALAPSPARSGGAAACNAEEGYFSTNGRWRVLATTAVAVGG